MTSKFTDIFWNTIYNDNTENSIKNELTESYDLILSDPPYNIDYNNNRRVKTRDKIYWVDWILNDKNNLEMIENVYNEYFRILKEWKHIYIFTRWDVAQDHINLLKKAWFVIKNNLIWMKNSWSMGDLLWDYAWQYENILFWYKPYSKWKSKWKWDKLNKIWKITRHSNILQYDRVVWNSQIHSHQKPIDLLQFLIKKSTNIGDKVYDWFIGSNSLWLWAISMMRKYSGAELNTDVFEKAKNITEELTNQLHLFINNKNNNKYLYIPELHLFLIDKKYLSKLSEDIIIKWSKSKFVLNKDYLKNSDNLEYNWFYIDKYEYNDCYIYNIRNLFIK